MNFNFFFIPFIFFKIKPTILGKFIRIIYFNYLLLIYLISFLRI